jgi:hypothetical protein
VTSMPGESVSRTVNLDLGNAAEQNMVAINAAHIAYVKLTGSMNSNQRRMEIFIANGAVISMNFDEADHAEKTFSEVIDTINRTIPDHLS